MKATYIATAFATATLLYAGTARAADKSPPACRLFRYTSLDMKTLPDGRIAIPVTIEGHTTPFLVDTGGVTATMTHQLAKELGHSPQVTNRWLGGVAGSLLNTYVRVDTMAIGPLKGKGLPVYLDPRIGGLGLGGTLAPDMMSQFDVELDFAHGIFSLFSSDHCPGRVVYWSHGYSVVPIKIDRSTGQIHIPITVNGKPLQAMIDTGSSTSVMSLDAAKTLGIDENSPDLKLKISFGADQRYKVYNYPFQTLDFEGVTVRNPHITILSNTMLRGFRDNVILGMGILRQLHLYIAYKEEKLYLTPALTN